MPLPPLATHVFTTSLSSCTVGNILLPMLQMAGTTLRSRRNLFNRPRSIPLCSSSPLETVQSDTHTVTDSFYGFWVYPSSFPPGLILLLSYSYHLFLQLAPNYSPTPRGSLHYHSPQLRSVGVLHCLNGRCHRPRLLCNSLHGHLLCGLPTRYCHFFEFYLVVFLLFLLLQSTARIFLLIPPHVFI